MLNISSPNCDLKILSASFFEIIVMEFTPLIDLKSAASSSTLFSVTLSLKKTSILYLSRRYSINLFVFWLTINNEPETINVR